jgi:peptide/nickel transport system ATP-binding protein
VGDIIAEPIRELKLIADEAGVAARVSELLFTVGLSPADSLRYPHAFSGGQRQRISIARALATQADILVCDEPTSALDVSVQAQILNLMRRLQDEFGLTYIFISHNLSVVRHMSDDLAIMYLGRIVELASTEALFHEPRHPYTRSLLDEVPRLDVKKRRFAALKGEIPSPLNPPPGCHFHPRCPLAMERCRIEAPALREVGAGRLSACHLNEGAQARPIVATMAD